MARLSSPVKVFTYSGRESGVMIVGSKEALGELASKLNAGLNPAPENGEKQWPQEIVDAEISIGPYQESKDWYLSFHIEGSEPAEKQVPLLPGTIPLKFALVIGGFAILGVISLARWVLNAF